MGCKVPKGLRSGAKLETLAPKGAPDIAWDPLWVWVLILKDLVP